MNAQKLVRDAVSNYAIATKKSTDNRSTVFAESFRVNLRSYAYRLSILINEYIHVTLEQSFAMRNAI